jgi:hypothetical protein
MAEEKPPETVPEIPGLPPLPDDKLSAAQKVAVFLTKARLDEYIDLMNRPWRLIWLNFISGVARGVGMVIGGGILAAIFILLSVRVLSAMLHHVGGLPWVGDQLADAIAWILSAIDQKKGA